MKKIFYCLIFFSLIFNQIKCKSLFLVEAKNENGCLSEKFVDLLKDLFEVNTFIETGTAWGENALHVSKILNEVHTIELYESSYNKAKQCLINEKNVHIYFGDSKIILHEVLNNQKNKNLLIYLDAHYSGPGTAKSSEVTPVLKELEIIKNYVTANVKSPIILIDDLRCFQHKPYVEKHKIREPLEEAARDYPDVNVIKDLILSINKNYKVIIYGDILLAFAETDIEISNIINAMTFIRFFNFGKDNILEFLDALKIIAQAKDEEKSAIEGLILRNGLAFPTLYTMYYRLWYVLTLLFNKKDKEAKEQLTNLFDYLVPAKTKLIELEKSYE